MTKQPLSRFLPILMVAVSLLLVAGASELALSRSASTRYKECSILAVSNPAEALKKAKAWRISNASSPIARHCEALALYGMKDYVGAASTLLALSKEAITQKPALSEELLLQAIVSYKMAGKYDAAIQAISDRLALPANTLSKESEAELSTERAKIYRITKTPPHGS